MKIEAYFTNSGVPATGLSATIRIRELPNTLVVTDEAMTEIGDGGYFYDYTAYNVRKDYAIRCDGGVSLTDSDRYKFAGNESYYEDTANAVWSDCLSDYPSGAGRNQQLQSFAGAVVYDSERGFAGTTFPIGTVMMPSNNLTDVLTIANLNNIDNIQVKSDLTIGAGQNVSKMALETHGIMGTDIVLSPGCSANNTVIRYANVSGEVTNGDTLLIESCQVGELENFTGIMNVVAFAQGAEITCGYWANFISCYAGGEAGNEPEINIGIADVSINSYTGNLKLAGKTGTNRTVANFQSGNVVVGSTCVSGTIQILGIGSVERDDSGPNCKVDLDAVITRDTIAEAVWDEELAAHNVSGSPGAALIGVTYNEKVCIDVDNGYSGTTYPIGLPRWPVNNLVDAKTIAEKNNIREFQLYSNLTIQNGESVDDYVIQAEQDIDVVVILMPGCSTSNTRFFRVIITGTFDGKSYIQTATALTVANFSGFMVDTILMGNVGVVDPAVPSLFSNCGGGKVSPPIEIDLNDSTLNIGGWKGIGKLINKTGTGANIIEMNTGQAIIDSTCVSGSIYITGVGQIISDDSGPGCTVDTSALLNRDLISNQVWSEPVSGYNNDGTYGNLTRRMAGLLHHNIFIDNPIYDGDGNLTSARVRIYSVDGSVGTTNDVIGTYEITAPGNGAGKFTNWKQVKV